MAKLSRIVMIDTGTFQQGVNELGDIIDIVDGDVPLGPACDTMEVVPVQLAKQEIKAILKAKVPPIKEVDGKFYWDSDGSWREIKKPPKHLFSLKKLSTKEIEDLNDNSVSELNKKNIITDKGEEKIHLHPDNNLFNLNII